MIFKSQSIDKKCLESEIFIFKSKLLQINRVSQNFIFVTQNEK